jgi:TRAP-type C4-dicarboxylate transport system substrate-binding protein
MNKKIVSLLLISVMVLVLAFSGCGGSDDEGSKAPAKDGETIKFTVNYFAPDSIPPGRALQWACDRATELSDGRLQFELFFNGTLISYEDQIQATADGTIDISMNDMGNISPYFNFVNLFTLPAEKILPDRTTMTDIYNKALVEIPELQEELATQNIHAIGLSSLGGYNLHLAYDTDLSDPSAVKGKMVNVASEVADYVKDLGASSTVVPPADYYLDLQKGTLDGIYCLWATLDGFKLSEVTKTHIFLGPDKGDHPYDGGGLFQPAASYMMNLDKWNSLSKEDQDIIVQAFAEAQDWWIAIDWASQMFGWEQSNKEGQKIHYLDTDEKVKPWLEPAKAYNAAWIKSCEDAGYPAQKAYDWLYKQIDEASANGLPDDWPGAVPSEDGTL